MKYTKSTIAEAIALNLGAKNEAEKVLRKAVDEANEKIRAKQAHDEDGLKKRVKELVAATEWYEALDLMKNTFESENAEELTDEQVKTSLCKARHYTSTVAKRVKETNCYITETKTFDFDVTDLLGKLEVSTEYKSEIGLLNLFIALRVNERLGNSNNEAIIYSFKTDNKVKEKIKAGADLSSNRQVTIAIQDCIRAFLPSCNYHAVNADWEYFVLGATALNKKALGSIKILPRRILEKMFYDYICLQIRNGGIAKYTIDYPTGKEAAGAGTPAPAAETPKPEETPKQEAPAEKPEEKVSEAPAPEKSKCGSKGGKGGKRGSKNQEAAA